MATLQFTVLMSVYHNDNSELFGAAIKSIFTNSIQPNQFVLVVDGYISNAIEEVILNLREIQQTKIDIIRKNKNEGLARALNEGLRYAKCPWVFRADADDINLPKRFSTLCSYIENNPQIDILGSYILEFEPPNTPVTIRKVPLSDIEIVNYLKTRNPFNHMSVAFRVKFILECGGYPDVFLREDYALWCVAISKGAKVSNIPEVLVHVTAGIDLFKRRGGVKYVKAEWKMQQLLVKYKFVNWFRALLTASLKSVIFLAPAKLREFIYLNFLRTKHEY